MTSKRNKRVSWGSSITMNSNNDVNLVLGGNPIPNSVMEVTIREEIRDQLDDEHNVYIDIRSSNTKERFHAGTVGSPITPPISTSATGGSSIEHLSVSGSLLRWKAIVVSQEGHKSAEMRDYTTYAHSFLGSNSDPLLKIASVEKISEGRLWELKFEIDSPVVCIPKERQDLYEALTKRKGECWILLSAIVEDIFDHLITKHVRPDGTEIDHHLETTWEGRWLKSAKYKFEGNLPELSGDVSTDLPRLLDWKKRVTDNIAASIDYHRMYQETEDDEN